MQRVLVAVLGDVGRFSRYVLGRQLRPYQLEVARAIVDSVVNRRGLTFSVMVSRQGGKNELSAQVEAFLLSLYRKAGGNIVKAAPTFKPQVINSKLRLEEMLNNPWTRGQWHSELGYIVRLGEARCMFFSAGAEANVVGATAHLALEFDEAQDIGKEKHSKDFLPMASSTNATRVYYGTAWDDSNLLEEMKEFNRQQERKDGIRRHFEYPWDVVAQYNPSYGRYVEGERARLGADHPLFRTQYELRPLAGGGRFLSPAQLRALRGEHGRGVVEGGGVGYPGGQVPYVAGVDVAGEDEASSDAALRSSQPRRDSTVVTIAQVDHSEVAEGVLEPKLLVRDLVWWTGRKHREVYEDLLRLFRAVYPVRRVVVDATGVGAGVASFLSTALSSEVVEQFVFSSTSKSALGYDLLSAINGERVKLFESDGSPECEEFWRECERARYDVKAHQALSFYVEESEGHDDFLMSLALCVRAGRGVMAAPARATVVEVERYRDGRY